MTAPSKTVSAKPTTPKPASRAKVVRKIVWGAAALAVVGAVVVASRPKPLAVETAAVRAGVMRVTVDEVGKTRVRDRYVISAPLAGNVARIELEPGDTIKPGAVLARIAPMDAPMLDARTRAQSEARVLQAGAAQNQARAAVTRAELAREDAKRDAEQSRKLAKGGSISAEALDNAVLAERGLLKRDLARALGISPQTATDICKGRSAVTLPHLRSLVRYFGLRPDFWLDESRLQPGVADEVVPELEERIRALLDLGVLRTRDPGMLVRRLLDFVREHRAEYLRQYGELSPDEREMLGLSEAGASPAGGSVGRIKATGSGAASPGGDVGIPGAASVNQVASSAHGRSAHESLN